MFEEKLETINYRTLVDAYNTNYKAFEDSIFYLIFSTYTDPELYYNNMKLVDEKAAEGFMNVWNNLDRVGL